MLNLNISNVKMKKSKCNIQVQELINLALTFFHPLCTVLSEKDSIAYSLQAVINIKKFSSRNHLE